jgi:PST family polysaccharide transporter
MSMPLMVYLAVYADNVILFVLGDNWGETAILFRLLAISAFIQPVDGTRGLIMLSFGYSKRYFYWGLISSSVIITSFIFGVHFGGASGVAIGYAIANYIIFIPSLMYCFKNTPITIGLFFRSISLPAQFSLLAGVISWLAKGSLENMITGLWFKQFDNVLIIAISLLIYGLSYIGAFWILPGGKGKLMVIIDIFKILYQRFFPTKNKQV